MNNINNLSKQPIPTNIIILAQARTGSCLLCNVFGMLNPCRNLNELFISYRFAENPANFFIIPHRYFFKTSELMHLFHSLKIDVNNYVLLLKYFSNNPQKGIDLLDSLIPVPKVIKILDHQMVNTDINFLYQKENTKFVLLDRSNKLEQFVSYEIAKKNGQWINTDTSNIKIKVDRTEFLNFINESNSWYDQIREKLTSNGHNFLEVNYEADLNTDNLDSLMFKIKDWLSVQGIETTVGSTNKLYKKQNSSPMSEKISNFDEIRDLIK